VFFQGVPTLQDRIESRLWGLAVVFMFLYSLALTLSPAARTRSWQADFRWGHWLGFVIWFGVFFAAHRLLAAWRPGRDPYLLPVVALLTGWGLMTVWRLLPGFGLRQSAWLLVSGLVLIAGLRLPPDLAFLRRYKYLWLTGSLLLMAATLLFGVNPLGYGPAMWLGCCGLYLQPSEPLKLLLIAYLAAYMADRQPFITLNNTARRSPLRLWPGRRGAEDTQSLPGAPLRTGSHFAAPLLPLLAPTLVMTGMALSLLAVQRDLGTAAIFLFLYTAVVYLASGQRSIVLFGAVAMAVAGLAGYMLFDVVRLRVDAWTNPWLDPSGRSYQIIQSILAVANGGLVGRGPGLGSPGLVPLAHSDFIFAAMIEESGLAGVVALTLLFGMLAVRGLRIALQARDHYQRYLAAGLTTYLVAQGLLIIGGSVRLLPLTGVTLPLVSYGGSSLLTSMVAILLLLLISSRSEGLPAPLHAPQPYLRLGALFLLGLAAAAVTTGWWAIYRGPDLLTRTDNQRRAIESRYVRRGSILARDNQPINLSTGSSGEISRQTAYPDLSSLAGYTDPTYGQAGLEQELDGYLRGLHGNPGLKIWWDHLVYGQPPPGLDVRLSLDLGVQRLADQLLRGQRGALVVLNAQTGEILALASHPGFDANRLAEQWDQLMQDPNAPLVNRATQGRYPFDSGPLFLDAAALPDIMPSPLLPLPADDLSNGAGSLAGYSPLQVALAAAAVSAGGVQPMPQLATAVNMPQTGWVLLSAPGEPRRVFSTDQAQEIAARHLANGRQTWQATSLVAPNTDDAATWYLGGTLPGQAGTPYAVALILESQNPVLAARIGQAVLGALR
jgi:cell division protein FtsW (lipid II flippase)